LRRAIRAAIESEKQVIELKVDGSLDSENNLKTLWTKLKTFLTNFLTFSKLIKLLMTKIRMCKIQ